MICIDIRHKIPRVIFRNNLLFYVISRAVRQLTVLKHHEYGIYAKYNVQIMLLSVYTTTR